MKYISLRLGILLLTLLPYTALGAQDKTRLMVNLVGVAVKSHPNFSSTSGSGETFPGYSSNWSYGGGVLLGIPVFNSVPGPFDTFYKMFLSLNLDLELGALYFNRNYSTDSSFSSTNTSPPRIGTQQTVLQLPVILRFGVPFGMSLGGGVYWGFNRTQDSNNNFSPHEFGGVASLQGYLGQRFGYRFLVDGRYTFSTSNVTTSDSVKTTFTDFQILFGVGI